MGLQDLEKDIYKRDYENNRSLRTAYDPDDTKDDTGEVAFGSKQWRKKSSVPKTLLDRLEDGLRKYWKIGLGIVVVLVIVLNFSLIRSAVFTPERFMVEVLGPTEVASGEVVAYRVRFTNANTLGVKGTELSVSLPDSFRVESSEGFSVEGNTLRMVLEDPGPHATGEVRFTGKFYGSKGEFSYIQATVRFAPLGLSSQFDSKSQLGVTVASSPLFLDTVIPLEAASGNEAEYVIQYRNDSDIPYSNVRIRADYPDGFRFSQAVPQQNEGDNIWRFGNILPGSSGEIRIRGTLLGETGEAKVFRAAIGTVQGNGTFVAYEEKERSTQMIVPPLSVVQLVNGRDDWSAKPGDTLNYTLAYANRGDIGLRDVIVTVEVDPALLDMTRLSAQYGGYYDSVKRMIVWNASVLPNLERLEPNQGGSVSFSVPLRKDIPTTTEGGKHLSVKTLAKIDSPDVPFLLSSNKVVASNLLEVRVGSVVDFSVTGFHTDTVIPNSGPIPPRVGEETTYMLRIRVVNYLNDLSDGRVTVTLPPGVRYTGKYLPQDEPVLYNERTGELVWSIGSMFGGGRTSRELSFQVAIVPGDDKVGESVTLVSGALFDAEDSFTGESVQASFGQKTTVLSEDAGIPDRGGSVVP
jgi:hypothetical protein